MRALIVDDSRFVRGFCAACSKKRESSARRPPTARPAWTGCMAAAFDLALVDWNMPVMNGLEMLKQMRAEGYSGVKVMMVTTEAENDFILRALDAGADEYLMKPFDDEALTKSWPCSAWWRPERWPPAAEPAF
jgi:two-component system chemotaxis response regulator CheY